MFWLVVQRRPSPRLRWLCTLSTCQGIARSALLSDAGIEPHSRATLTSSAFVLNNPDTPTTVRATWAEFVWSEVVEKQSTAALLKFARAAVDASIAVGAWILSRLRNAYKRRVCALAVVRKLTEDSLFSSPAHRSLRPCNCNRRLGQGSLRVGDGAGCHALMGQGRVDDILHRLPDRLVGSLHTQLNVRARQLPSSLYSLHFPPPHTNRAVSVADPVPDPTLDAAEAKAEAVGEVAGGANLQSLDDVEDVNELKFVQQQLKIEPRVLTIWECFVWINKCEQQRANNLQHICRSPKFPQIRPPDKTDPRAQAHVG